MRKTAAVLVDSHLHLPDYFWDYEVTHRILDDLTIPNQEKIIAKRMKRWGWEKLPDDFLLADNKSDHLILPRGYALRLKTRCTHYGIKIQWVDRRLGVYGSKFRWKHEFMPRDHQPEAVRKIRRYQQGMYEAPTGSGKSLTCISFIHDVSPGKTIVLTDQIGLVNQWNKEVGHWLGEENVSVVGGGKWDDSKRIVVATLQTIWSGLKQGEIHDDWFSEFDAVIVDECHHVPANTIREIVSKFPAFWRFGVSATTDRKNGKFEFALAVLGEVFHIDDEATLRRAGVLVKPIVQVVETGYTFDYWPDHEAEQDDEGYWRCQKPGCKIKKAHFHRNNYQKLRADLVKSQRRNITLSHVLYHQIKLGKHIHLIVSDEIRQLDFIQSSINSLIGKGNIPVYRLTGEVTGKKRRELIERISNSPEAIVLATVAKEGLDIPRVDRIYLPFPSSSAAGTKQKVGRGTRVADGKKNTIIFDFVDDVLVLRKQFRKRRYGFYDKSGMQVIM